MDGATGIACDLNGNRVFVTGVEGGAVSIVDVSNPRSPTLTGSLIDSFDLDAPVGVVYDAANDYLFVACRDMNGFAILSVATGASNPSIIGTVKGNLNAMKYAMYLSYYPGGKLLFVSGYESDSLCVADVSDPSSPTVLDWETSSTYMDGARGVAFDPVTRNVLVAAQNSDSLAVLNLTGTITGSVASGRRRLLSIPTSVPTMITLARRSFPPHFAQ